MNPHDLLSICAASFLGVFIILAALAVIMRLILVVFPQRESVTEEAVLAAIATTYKTHYPGTRITRVEEER